MEPIKSKSALCKTLGISRPTLYRYIRQGKIKAKQHPITGRISLESNEIIKLLEKVKGYDL